MITAPLPCYAQATGGAVDVTTHKFRPKISPSDIVPPLPPGTAATNQWGIGAGAAQQIKALAQGRFKTVFATLLGLPMIMLMAPFFGRRRDRKRQRVWPWMGFLLLLLLLAGCGSGTAAQSSTPPGTYAVQVTVTSGTVQGSATINLTVTQ